MSITLARWISSATITLMKTAAQMTAEINNLLSEMEAFWAHSDLNRVEGYLDMADWLDQRAAVMAASIVRLQAERNRALRAQRIFQALA